MSIGMEGDGPNPRVYSKAEYDALAAECERLRMQLAACGVVALSNTPESAVKARDMHPDYMSASCQDVMRAVDAEMALRTERDAALAELAEEQALRERMAELLRQSAVALRGPEPPLTRYSYADIPSRVKAVVEELAALKGGAGPLRADQMQVHGYYWWLPACFEDKPDDPRNWSVYNWHPSHPVKSGLFVGPILSPADAAPPAPPAQASAWVPELSSFAAFADALGLKFHHPDELWDGAMALHKKLTAAPTPGASDGKGGE